MEESRSSLEILIAKAVQSIDLMLVFMFFLISQLHFSFACWSKFDVSSPALLDFVLWPWRWPISDGSWSADGSFVIFTAHSLISMHDGMQWSFYSAVKQKHPCLSPLVSFDLCFCRIFRPLPPTPADPRSLCCLHLQPDDLLKACVPCPIKKIGCMWLRQIFTI